MKTRLLAALLFAILSCTASAAVTVFTDSDPGAGPADAHPNSDAARAAFLAASPQRGRIDIDFENMSVGIFTSGPIGPGVSLTSTNQDTDCPFQGISDTDNIVLGYNTTPGGSNHLGFCTFFGGSGQMAFHFLVPIDAFGAYFSAIEPEFSTSVTLEFDDGGSQSIPLTGFTGGGVSYYGFTDPEQRITTVAFNVTNQPDVRDLIGIDDISVATGFNPVPVNNVFGLLALVLALLAGGMIAMRKRPISS